MRDHATTAEILTALHELEKLVHPHLLSQDTDPAMTAIDQAVIGLRRMLTHSGPIETDDAVARLDRAADYARAVHATTVKSFGDLTSALANEASDPDLVSVDHATVAAYDPVTDETHSLDVRWGETHAGDITLQVGGRTLTDPVEVQRVAYALSILAQTAANTVYPD